MQHPKLRDSKKLQMNELYPINEFPLEVIRKIGKKFIYYKFVGRTDISGNDWADVFAEAIGVTHKNSSLGLTDVSYGKMAWSMKTIKVKKPHTTNATIRLITGRNSTDRSFDLEKPYEDPQKTGNMVLQIWNDRVNIAYEDYISLRTCVLIRDYDLSSFTLFEEDTPRFAPSAYKWTINKNKNLIGIDIETGKTKFTWQPGGSQFTIHTHIPKNALKFKIKQPPVLDFEETLKQIKYTDDWVELLG